jgi:AAA domain, putative AbiEii toxin, Type IV TA system
LRIHLSQLGQVQKIDNGEYVACNVTSCSFVRTDYHDDYSFLFKIFNYQLPHILETENKLKDIMKEIKERYHLIDHLIPNLKQFSPIKDIKIDWDSVPISLHEAPNGKAALIEDIEFQFFVNNEWVKWHELSNGARRSFYIIGNVTYATTDQIILIEHPELAIHPHQLALLMNFLKSESEDKQIIISTHSPQVLNCLGADELDRIIVARHEGKAGTKLYHLSEEEKGYASEFMEKEAFLSDYWMLSGFMNEEMPEDV